MDGQTLDAFFNAEAMPISLRRPTFLPPFPTLSCFPNTFYEYIHVHEPTRLRLRLARGEVELVRRVLWKLRAVLAELLLRTKTTTNANNLWAGDSNGSSATTQATTLANYSEATEMLVVQIMLPCGESTEASALVSNDTHLGTNDRIRLLKECELSMIRTGGEHESDIAPRGDGERTAGRTHAHGSGDAHSRQGRTRRASTGGSENDGRTRFEGLEPSPDDRSTARHGQQQQGPVHKFFSDVSGWTPEARIQLVVGAGAAGLAAYAALRNRGSLWRAARSAIDVAARTAGDIGGFIVGSA